MLVPSRSRMRWLMLALLWLAYAAFGITAGSLAPLVNLIVADLGITYSQIGLVMGAWQLIYIGTAAPLGALVDRLGIRRSLGLGILVVWVSLVARGLAVDFYTLALAVALFGFGGPIISIGAPKLVSVWFEERERGIAAGIYTVGSVSGMAFALATASSLVVPWTGSWRGISLVYGTVVLAVLVLWWALARDAPAPLVEGEDEGSGRERSPWRVARELWLLRNVKLILVLAGGTFLVNHGLNNWIPTLLQERGMTLQQAGFWAAAAIAVGTGGLLVIPILARHGYRVLALVGLLVVGVGTTIGLALLQGPALVSSLLLSTAVRNPLMPVLTLVLMETPGVGARRMGAAGGLFFAAAEIGGFSGPLLMGVLRDATGALTTGALVLAGVTAALMPVVLGLREERGRAVLRRD